MVCPYSDHLQLFAASRWVEAHHHCFDRHHQKTHLLASYVSGGMTGMSKLMHVNVLDWNSPCWILRSCDLGCDVRHLSAYSRIGFHRTLIQTITRPSDKRSSDVQRRKVANPQRCQVLIAMMRKIHQVANGRKVCNEPLTPQFMQNVLNSGELIEP